MKEKNEFEKHQAAKKYHEGKDLALRGRYEEAIEAYNKAIELNGNNIDISSAKMISALQLERLEEAIESYDNAMDIHKSDVDGDHNEWTKYIIREMELRREDAAINYNNNGCDLSRVEKYEEALEEHNKAIRLDPYNIYFLKEKADVLLKLGRGDEAIEVFDEVIALEPDNDKSYSSKGYILAKLGRYEESIVEYERAIELHPNYACLYKNKGDGLREIGRDEEAMRCYDKAIEIYQGLI